MEFSNTLPVKAATHTKKAAAAAAGGGAKSKSQKSAEHRAQAQAQHDQRRRRPRRETREQTRGRTPPAQRFACISIRARRAVRAAAMWPWLCLMSRAWQQVAVAVAECWMMLPSLLSICQLCHVLTCRTHSSFSCFPSPSSFSSSSSQGNVAKCCCCSSENRPSRSSRMSF